MFGSYVNLTTAHNKKLSFLKSQSLKIIENEMSTCRI